MLIKMLAVLAVGIIGGLAHRMLFEKRFYLPKFKKDTYGWYLDLGILEDIFAGIIAATLASLPIINHVPVFNLIGTCLIPAIAGRAFLKSAIQQYVDEKKRLLQAEIEQLEEFKKELEKEEKEKEAN